MLVAMKSEIGTEAQYFWRSDDASEICAWWHFSDLRPLFFFVLHEVKQKTKIAQVIILKTFCSDVFGTMAIRINWDGHLNV